MLGMDRRPRPGFPTMPDTPRRIEREFGVPFPGEILPAEKWTQTALKRMPALDPLPRMPALGRLFAQQREAATA